MEMHLLLGVEGEEGEAVEGAGALTMVEATAKEVRHTLATKVSLHFVERKSRCVKQHIQCMSSFQVDSEHMVTGTVLMLDTVSIDFTNYNPILYICSLLGLQCVVFKYRVSRPLLPICLNMT